MTKPVWKQNILKLNPLAVFYYFCTTVVVVRGWIFVSLFFDAPPAIFLNGWHIHHFVFGFLFLAVAIDESRKKNFPVWILEVFYGIGLGLIFDEFAYWTFGMFDYWSIHNFYAMLSLSIAAGILTQLDRRSYRLNLHRKHIRMKEFSFKRHFAVPCLSFLSLLLVFFITI